MFFKKKKPKATYTVSSIFSQPEIFDRRIHKFNACTLCNKKFVDKDGKLSDGNSMDKTNGITTVSCKCGEKYRFRNWDMFDNNNLKEI